MEKSENKYLKQAMEELAYLSSDPDFKRLVEAREGFLKDQEAFEIAGIEKGKAIGLQDGLKKGKAIGLKDGLKKKAREIAKKLLKMNLPIEQIVEITGLTKEEIENLK